MPNYQEGKIYKIYNTINDDIYVGSTTRKLCERMGEHRSRVKYRDKHKPLSQSILEHGVENFFIELIEKCPCNDKDELLRAEGKYIRELKPSMNKKIAGRTNTEYLDDSRENRLEKMQTYYQENKEHLAPKRKEWSQNNKERINISNRNRREINHDSLARYYQEKIKCDCGSVVSRAALTRHKKCEKHLKFVQEN